jgi:hypothetical protein
MPPDRQKPNAHRRAAARLFHAFLSPVSPFAAVVFGLITAGILINRRLASVSVG